MCNQQRQQSDGKSIWEAPQCFPKQLNRLWNNAWASFDVCWSEYRTKSFHAWMQFEWAKAFCCNFLNECSLFTLIWVVIKLQVDRRACCMRKTEVCIHGVLNAAFACARMRHRNKETHLWRVHSGTLGVGTAGSSWGCHDNRLQASWVSKSCRGQIMRYPKA